MTSTTQAVRSGPVRRRTGTSERTAGYWWYLAPGAIGFAAVVLVPFGMNIWYSFHSWSGVGTMTPVGLSNYTTLFHDATFWTSFRNSIYFIVAMAIIPTALGVLVAAVLFDFIAPRFGTRTGSILRATFYLPQILPIAVAGVLWKWMYQPDYGVINTVLRSVGLGSLAQNWLGDAHLAIYAVMNVLVWLQIGYTVVIFMAGLSRVDPALYEAAELDGANWWQRFRTITLNQLRPEIAVVLITTSVAALKVFAPIYMLTKGGPGTSTIVPSYFSYYNFFTTMRVGYGAAVATVLAVVVTVVAVVAMRYQARSTEGLDQ
ncbi:sugar ABC transporter permease [Luteimicrobium xylanilyticum]|uniref:Putative ABC transporter permease protein n=1 Tax=Luteimicrobium xylanilyticum TaxID=1133546 RepID=A0A5P9QE53_9MICO|nr:sugar ABC transporter permease [Luteimicrobium xylanilyticum]QFU99758.1 putative ABC transporter permease protein [Luteimicrobium xylanilyticum]